MRIQRIVPMNPVEAPQISLRVPASMPLTLDLQYIGLDGQPLTSDLAAQLQLTARSCVQTLVYPAPATDVVNGKARVAIGGDVLNDPNGYRMRLFGTYLGEAILLALGTMRITESAGVAALPTDTIDFIPITLNYNFGAGISIYLWSDAGKETPFDLTSATITAAVYDSQSSQTLLTPFTVNTAGPGNVVLQLTDVQVNALPPNCWWSLRASNAAGVTTLCEGPVTVLGTISEVIT
jgi:hypothetical protein